MSGQLPFQSPMTDLKDSSLSLLLQITSSDMFGHADNVLNENSFQGWMGYKLSTPRVGYFFNCSFILLGERQQGGTRKESGRELHEAGIRLCGRRRRASDESVWERERREAVLSLWLSVSGSEGDEHRAEGVSLLTQARKSVWSVYLRNCDWIHFCGLGCVFGRGSRSLHLLCVVVQTEPGSVSPLCPLGRKSLSSL